MYPGIAIGVLIAYAEAGEPETARPWRYPRAFEEPMPERRKAAVKMPGMN